MDLEMLLDAIGEAEEEPDAALHACKLSTKYIAQDAEFVSNKNFESGVVKIQRELLEELTDD